MSDLAKKGYQPCNLQESDIPNDRFNGVEKLYILAGMGGNTGSAHINGAIKSARSAGVKDFAAIVTTPFYFEGENKVAKAKEALEKLNGVSTKVLHNDDLLKLYADINFATAFHYADMTVLKAIESGEI